MQWCILPIFYDFVQNLFIFVFLNTDLKLKSQFISERHSSDAFTVIVEKELKSKIVSISLNIVTSVNNGATLCKLEDTEFYPSELVYFTGLVKQGSDIGKVHFLINPDGNLQISCLDYNQPVQLFTISGKYLSAN